MTVTRPKHHFGRGLPGFSVPVGVLRDGRPIAGAVYDPLADWLFDAEEGQGGALPAPVARWLERYRLRRFGSTALHLCYVALGALAFVHDHAAAIWDVAGATAVLLEAGGVITHPDGRPLFPVDVAGQREIRFTFVAGDPSAHAQAVTDLR